MGRAFRSDNNAGITDEAMRAMVGANGAHAPGYGGDEWTERAEAAFRDLFGDALRGVFFVATGTAANVLAVSALTRPWQRVLCHSHAHWNDDESTAPEMYTGCRTTTIEPSAPPPGECDARFARPIASKLTPEDVERAAMAANRGDVHQPAPGALTVSTSTEFGEVYTPEELREVCGVAHRLGYRAHVDGARFANAVASVMRCLGMSWDDRASARRVCRAMISEAGVDALSFGGTKNGLALGEAVLLFGDAGVRASEDLPWLRKRSAHLLSKHRFVSAPFAATLESGSWLASAFHANAMARELASGLSALGLKTPYSVDANGVFIQMDAALEESLRRRGFGFYLFGDPSWRLARLMCSFDTERGDVDALLGAVKESMA